MKKKILIIASALLITASATIAQTNSHVPTAIANELYRDFKGAENIEWKTTDQFYKATFTSNGITLEAFYDKDGKFLGVSRNISINQLPIALLQETEEKGNTDKVVNLFELSSAERGTEYYITYQNRNQTLTFKSTGTSWTRY